MIPHMSAILALSPDSIYLFAQKIWWFLVVLGVLVTFHEFGHFLAARWVGVKVLKFSLGFGPKIFGRTVGETEYLVSAVPLGGYVKLFGEDAAEPISLKDQQQSFSHQSLSHKMLIVAAGPGFNFLLTYLIFTIWLAAGSPLFVPTFQDITPKVEAIKPGSPADFAGFKVGDRILRANEEDITTYGELSEAVQSSRGKRMTIDVLREDKIKTLFITPESQPNPQKEEETIYLLGIEAYAPIVGEVVPDTPAMEAGLESGDRVIEIEGATIHTWSQMTEIVRAQPGQPLNLKVKRKNQVVSVTVTPAPEEIRTEGGQVQVIGKIGIILSGRSVMSASSILTAPIEGMVATWKWAELTLVGVYKLLVGEISTKNLGGPLMIASVSGEHAEQGISNVIFLIAVLSMNLGILNLLPIPILDGGHLFFFTCEAILGRPLGERSREIAQQVGLVLLFSIMIYATWNDITRLLH